MTRGLVANTEVRCPACGEAQQVTLVRSLNTRTDPSQKAALLRGELNLLVCGCGKRTPMAADLLFHDPGRNGPSQTGQTAIRSGDEPHEPAAPFFCQVCVGDEAAITRIKLAFEESGVAGERRIVRSMNALREKVKILDAGLKDWAIEMAKVLLLTTLEQPTLDEVLLFDALDPRKRTLSWVLFRSGQTHAQLVTSPLGPYEKGLPQWRAVAPGPRQFEIDRVWALAALRKVMPLPV